MFGRSCWRLLFVLLVVMEPIYSAGQRAPVAAADVDSRVPRLIRPPMAEPIIALRRPSSGEANALPELARSAGTIVGGTVTSIERRAATRGHAIETVAITLRVEHAIRGATPGDTFTFVQWIGLWSAGQRYRSGERVLLFLYPPSKLGLSSCVSAPLGRFPLDQFSRVLMDAQQLSAFRTDPVIGGKSRASLSDFALAVRQASEEE